MATNPLKDSPDFEARYLALVGSHADLVSRCDANGILTFASASFTRLFDKAPDALIGTSIYDLIIPEGRECTRRRFAGISPETPSVSGRDKVAAHGGGLHHIDSVTIGLFSDDGDLLELQSIGRDVTSFLDVHERLSESETRYDQAVQIARIGYWLWDEKEDSLEYCSHEAATIYGITVEEAMDRSSTLAGNVACVDARDRSRYEATVEQAAQDAASYDITFRYQCPAGGLLYLREIAEPILDKDGLFVQTIGTIQDVTDQKLAEQELRDSQELLRRQVDELRASQRRLQAQSRELSELARNLERTKHELMIANDQKNRMFSIIAHDLKSPFTPLLGFSELMAESIDDLPRETVRDYASSIHQTALEVHTLLDDLLDWSRLQLDHLTVEPAEIDMHMLATNQLGRFRQAAQAKNITLAVNNLTPCSKVHADDHIVETVLRNLVSNAIKFTPTGGEVSINLDQQDDRICLAVCDNGNGIPGEILCQLFSPGPITSRDGTRGEKGTGLGLMLCRDLMELHGSELAITSGQGGGTRAAFTLPAHRQN